MANPTNFTPVAVAVLIYQDELLLATRHKQQHQGGKLEFVGGKIEQGETAMQALNREVAEEIGLDISSNAALKLGRIFYDYGDKAVCLHVYQVALTKAQYAQYQTQDVGLLGQKLAFYDRFWAVKHPKRFPCANRAILSWLTLNTPIIISQSVAQYPADVWLTVYQNSLPAGALFYVRPKGDNDTSVYLISALAKLRPDVRLISTLSDFLASQTAVQEKIFCIKLTADELLKVSKNELTNLPSDVPLLLGVHDEKEAKLVNHLAATRLVIGALVSPVKPTKTHPDSPALGWSGLKNLAKQLNVPVIALGGLSAADLVEAKAHGAVGVSGIRGFINIKDK